MTEVGGGCGADVEVLVEPEPLACAGEVEAALLPVAADALFLAALREDVADALRDVEVSAGTVAVALLVVAGLEAGDVGLHHAGAHDHEGVGAAAAAALPLIEGQLLDVRDEVGLPDAALPQLGLGAKVLGLAGVAVTELVGVIEDEVLAAHTRRSSGRSVTENQRADWDMLALKT